MSKERNGLDFVHEFYIENIYTQLYVQMNSAKS